jgi:hypothetical protein
LDDEWLVWLQRVDRKLDRFLEKTGRIELPAVEARDAFSTRLSKLEERVANIEGKLDISTAFEPN